MQHIVSPAATKRAPDMSSRAPPGSVELTLFRITHRLRPAGSTRAPRASVPGRGRSAPRRSPSSLSCRSPGDSATPAALWKLQQHRRSAPAKKFRTRPSLGLGQGRGDVSACAVDGDLQPVWSGLLELKELSPAIVAVCATVTALSAAFTLWLGFQMLPLNKQKQELDIKKGQRDESEELEIEKNDENVLAAIGKGNTEPVDSEQFIRREAPLTDIVRILRAERAEQGFTYVVAGPKAAGKTTLALMACGEVSKGVVRVIISTPDDPKETRSGFAKTLAKALNFKLRDDDKDPWDTVQTALDKAAATFSASEGKPVVLVVDQATFLLKDPVFTEKLLAQAKIWADSKLVQVVFVASDGVFPQVARDFDKGGGRLEILPIRGPTKEEALAFLQKVNLLTAADDPATRAKMTLVAELVGDRFTLVQKFAKAARGVNVTQQDVETQVEQLVMGQLATVKLDARYRKRVRYAKAHVALAALADAGGRISSEEFFTHLSEDEELLQALIDGDIVSPGGAQIVEFTSRAAQWFVKAKRMPPPRLPPPPLQPSP